MALFQQIKKEEEPSTVVNAAMEGLQRAFEKDTLKDSTDLSSGITLSTSLVILDSGSVGSIEIPLNFASDHAEID